MKQSGYEIFLEKSEFWKLYSVMAISAQLLVLQQFLQITKVPFS